VDHPVTTPKDGRSGGGAAGGAGRRRKRSHQRTSIDLSRIRAPRNDSIRVE